MNEKAVIIKTLTHNIALCQYRDLEILLFGKGIAFGKKAGDVISFLDVDKVYQIKDIDNLNAYADLVSRASEEVTAVSEEIIGIIGERFGNQYNEKIHISLLDHLNFSLARLESGLEVSNLFGDETKYMYPEEYEFAAELVQYINKRLDVKLPESEISFIALHIHSALNGEEASVSSLIMSVVNTCVAVIEEDLDIRINKKSFLQQRLITHIKFAVRRSFDNITLDNPLAPIIEEKYPYSYGLAEKMNAIVSKKYGFSFSQGEKAYLSLHIENIIKESEEI